MIPNSRSISVILILCLMAIFLNTLPGTWVIYVPVIFGWFAISAIIAVFITPFVDEWLEQYRD